MGNQNNSDDSIEELESNSLEERLLLAELESDIQEELNQLVAKRFSEIEGELKLAGEGLGVGMSLDCAIRVGIHPSMSKSPVVKEPEQLPLLRTFSPRRCKHVDSVEAEERVMTRSSLLHALGLVKKG